MKEIEEAIKRLNRAIDELEKRQAAKAIGAAIGAALGTTVSIYRTDAQIDAMSLSEIDTWAGDVATEIA